MTIISKRGLDLLLLCLFINALMAPMALAESDSGPMEIHNKFFKGMYFSMSGGDQKPVFGFAGLSLHEDFKTVIGSNPEAAKLAQSATTYNAIAFVGQMGMLVIVAMDLADTISDANDINSGSYSNNDSSVSLMPILVTGGVAIVFGIMGKNRVKAGVEAFNAASTTSLKALDEQDPRVALSARTHGAPPVQGTTLVRYKALSW